MKRTSITYVDFILIFVTFLWGINPTIMKVGLRYIPPVPYNALRMVFAVITSWIIVFMYRTYTKISREDFKKLFFVSLFGFFVFQLCFAVGVNMTTAGNAALIAGTLPISVAIINKTFGIEEITHRMLMGIILSIVGVLFIIMGSGKAFSLSTSHIKGGILLLIAQVGYGYYTVFSKELSKKYSNSLVAAYIVTITTVLFIGISAKSVVETNWVNIPLKAWLSNIYSGIFAICVGNFLWVYAVQKMGSTKASLYNNLPPIFGIITGCVFLSEPFGFIQLIGAIVIFIGLYMTRDHKGRIQETSSSQDEA